MQSLSANPIPASSPAAESTHKRKVELTDAAAMLLPGLLQARTLLDVSIQVLSHFAPPPPQGMVSDAETAARIRRVLAEFGHPPVRR